MREMPRDARIVNARLEPPGHGADDRQLAQPPHERPERIVPSRPGERSRDRHGEIVAAPLAAKHDQFLVIVARVSVAERHSRDAAEIELRGAEGRRTLEHAQRFQRDRHAEAFLAPHAIALVAGEQADAKRRQRDVGARDERRLLDPFRGEPVLGHDRVCRGQHRVGDRVRAPRIPPVELDARRNQDARVAPLERERHRAHHRPLRHVREVGRSEPRAQQVRRRRDQHLAERVRRRLNASWLACIRSKAPWMTSRSSIGSVRGASAV